MSETLEKTVAAFLRNSLAERYALENIRTYSGFDNLSEEQITALRTFGLRYIYPEWDNRCFQREVFHALMALLSTPMRLKPLVAAALKSLWRFGAQLPRAIDAGKKLISAVEATQELEQRLVTLLREILPDTKKPKPNEICEAISRIPREEYEVFIGNMVALMQLLAERALLDTGHNMLQNVSTAMDKRPDRYTDIEREGMHYALQVMEEGLALFAELDDAVVEEAIAAIPQVELDWYDSIVTNAG